MGEYGAMTERRPGIQFSPTIELGHILQALIMLGGLTGWMLWGYQTIDRQLSQHANEMALMKHRMTVSEQAAAELRETVKSAFAEMRQNTGKISDQLGDLRTLVAGQGRK